MTQPTTPAEIGTTIRIPIADLTVDPNIRKVTKIPAAFASSVKQHGVLTPVEGYQVDGTWHLGDGQLRYLASLDAGHTDIPVLVTDPALAESTRVIRQLILNEHRTEITEADRAGAYQTLFEMGVSADAIARKANAPKKSIERALDLIVQPGVPEALERGVTLDQIAQILEFEDEAEVVAELTTTAAAEPQKLPHRIAEIRKQRKERAEKAAAAAPIEERGIPVFEPGIEFKDATPITQLYADAKYKKSAVLEDFIGRGLRAILRQSSTWINGEWTIVWTPEYFVKPIPDGYYVRTSTKAPLTEKELAERKVTRESNKAWPIATEVRQEWIATTLLQGKLTTSDVISFLATAAAGEHPRDSNQSGRLHAQKWLGLSHSSNHLDKNPLAKELAERPDRAQLIALAVAIGQVEAKIEDKEGWRVYWTDAAKIATYLEQLVAWGYGLAAVEEQIIATAKAAGK